MKACKDCGCKDGDRGPIGPAGLKGETGDAGLQGNPGPQGEQGEQGHQGIQGNTGIQGIQGPPGASISGTAGAVGPIGLTGDQGATGPAGADGTDGTNGNNGQGRITYIIDSGVGIRTITAILNEGIIMKNTLGIVTIELPPSATIGDVVRIVGTSFGTGGWKLKAFVTDTIQMTDQSPVFNETSAGGFVQPSPSNYRDVITLISDGDGQWIITSSVFANGNIPLFN
jgi:hypothetical protein